MNPRTIAPCAQFSPGRALPIGICETCGWDKVQHAPAVLPPAIFDLPDVPNQTASGVKVDEALKDHARYVLMAERDAWMGTAAQHLRNEQYYRGLLEKIGAMFGDAALTAEDGSKPGGVLVAKVPELVESLMAIKGYRQKPKTLEDKTAARLAAVHEMVRKGEPCEEPEQVGGAGLALE